MWNVCDILYSVLYVRLSCFVVRGCAVSRRYINACNCDMFCVVNVYLDHLKLWVVCTNGRRYVCCSEYNVVSNECNEPTPCLVRPIGHTCSQCQFKTGVPQGGVLSPTLFNMYTADIHPFHSLDNSNNQFASLAFCRNSAVYNVRNGAVIDWLTRLCNVYGTG